jgi:transposase
MGLARYVVDAVLLEGRSAREVAAAHGISKSWIYVLIKRYRAGGYEALEPRSRRPRSCGQETPVEVVQAIVALRWELQADGHDAGAATIAYHLAKRLDGIPSRATIWWILKREGLIAQSELERLGIASKNSRPYHPQTCGKIERLHQTLKRYLAKQLPANGLPELQGQLDAFVHYYNDIRPHRALDGRTPLQAYSTRIKAKPTNGASRAPTHFRVRQDKVDQTGKVSLRYHSKLYKIGVGRAHKGQPVKLLIADLDIRVIDCNGQLLRQLTLDPGRTYQPITAA